MITRRMTLAGLGSLPLAGCARPCPGIALPAPAMGRSMVDAHCHLFNVKDLSATKFITQVVLEHYPELSRGAMLTANQTPIDLIVKAVLLLVGAPFAPSAANELALLDGRRSNAHGEDHEAVPPAERLEETIDRVADFLGERALGVDRAAEDDLRRMIWTAGGAGRADLTTASRTDRRAIARRALAGDATGDANVARAADFSFDIKGLFYFAGQLRRYRHCLVDELTALHRKAGENPVLLTPAMVDFGRWLDDDPKAGSSFVQQSAVWSRIARRRSGPAVHGYVGFCPLRQVQYDRGLLGPGRPIATACDADPLRVVRTALDDYGFLGVKLYPPMGFRASSNSPADAEFQFPKEVLRATYGDASNASNASKQKLAAALDDALDRLYRLCGQRRVPIMAHGANSIAAFENSGLRADPYYWQPVFDRPNAPPVMLAHFGGFEYESADPAGLKLAKPAPAGEPVPFELSWEASLARYIERHPELAVFADVSMFTELFASRDRAFLLERFRILDQTYPAMKHHLVFGTDWLMLATESRANDYDRLAREFLTEIFKGDALDDIMRGNFLRFSGLAAGQPNRARIEAFYAGDPVLLDRLGQLDSARSAAATGSHHSASCTSANIRSAWSGRQMSKSGSDTSARL